MNRNFRAEFSASADSVLCARRRTQSISYYSEWITISGILLVVSFFFCAGNVAAQKIIESRCTPRSCFQNTNILPMEYCGTRLQIKTA